jgi:hypothetical protein
MNPLPVMSNREPRKRNGGLVVALLIVMLVAPLLYFLSVGPMAVQLDRGAISQRHFDRLYQPLLSLSRTWPAFRALCVRYSSYWRTSPPGIVFTHSPLPFRRLESIP